MIDLRYVKKLIEIIDESTVDSIEITSDKGMKIRISKSPQQRGAMQVAAPVPMPADRARRAARAHLARAGHSRRHRRRRSAPPSRAKPAGLEVKSPMVGTFYSRRSRAARRTSRWAIASRRDRSSASSRR